MQSSSTTMLGVRIDFLTQKQALEKAASFLSSEKAHRIYTPNPEMLVAARQNVQFQHVLNESQLNLCDGSGIQFLSFGKIKERIPGIDFMEALLALANEKGGRVFFLGSNNDTVLKDLQAYVQKKYPNVVVAGMHKGPKDPHVDEEEIDHAIIMAAPEILFVAFGHEKQEMWIDRNVESFPSVRIAMGVGGSFDCLSGHKKRAPKLFQKLHVEWLWRLLREPNRAFRIFRAVFVFPLFVILDRFSR